MSLLRRRNGKYLPRIDQIRIPADHRLIGIVNRSPLANTVWVIASRVEDNVSLLDMISNALDQTLQNTGDLYILHDDFGKLNLSFLGDMYVPIMIDAETGQNYDYESSIDENTYNRIKLKTIA